jgi:tripartite-type tricarboxylate transporter receptor subunit TctC
MVPVGSTPAEFDQLIRAQITKWQEIATASGISVD